MTNIVLDIKYFLRYELLSSLIFGPVWTDRRTESDAYDPAMQNAQVDSKTGMQLRMSPVGTLSIWVGHQDSPANKDSRHVCR